jgi:hypothetical protein
LREALPLVLEKRLKLAVLPHPEAKEACIGLGVNRQLEKAVDHLKKLEVTVLTDPVDLKLTGQEKYYVKPYPISVLKKSGSQNPRFRRSVK